MTRPQFFKVTMRDGSVWSIPVEVIARDRAENYKEEFDNDVERSLAEDTWPLFESDPYEVVDWAINNMNWSDVENSALRITAPPPLTADDFQEGWMNGDNEVV